MPARPARVPGDGLASDASGLTAAFGKLSTLKGTRVRPDGRSRGLPQKLRAVSFRGARSRPGPKPNTATDRKSTCLNSSHANISYAVFCLKKKKHIFLYVIFTHE